VNGKQGKSGMKIASESETKFDRISHLDAPYHYRDENGQNVTVIPIKGAKEYLDKVFTLINQSYSQRQK